MNATAVRHTHANAAPRFRVRHTRLTAPALGRLAGSFLVAAAAIVVLLALAITPEQPTPTNWSAVSVEHTGTLWEIAAEHRVEGLTTAETVDLIREENGLSSSTLYAGQTLVVPASPSEALAIAQR